MVPRNTTSRAFAYIWQSKWVPIIAIKTERTQIHFFSDVLIAVASLDLKVPSISSKTWCHGLSLISNNSHTRCEHLCIIFSASAPSGPNLFSITRIKVMTSGIAFDRPDRLSRLRAFPYDRFKIYMIVPIVRIELNSIQAIEVVSVVRVVCDRLGSVSIRWSSRSSEHFLRRLGRSGRSGRSYGNQALVLHSSSIFFWLSRQFLLTRFLILLLPQ